MWRKSLSKPQAGFTIPEVLVTLIILVAILVVAAQVLFETRNAAERQRAHVEARQYARSAAEYVHYMLRGSTDLNTKLQNVPNPLLLLIYAQKGNNPPYQTTYDNLTAAQAAAGLGDEGTDIITFARADNIFFAPVVDWPGWQHAATLCFEFTIGCPDSLANLQLFKEVTGAHLDEQGKLVSEPFLIVGANGEAGFIQITDYAEGPNADNCVPKPGRCTDAGGNPKAGLQVNANPGLSDQLNPPGGQPGLTQPVVAELGVRYVTLRVRNGWLEQKNGPFDPATDNPGNAFFQVLPNVEDFQVVYFFRDGTVRNNLLPRDCSWAANCVPVQDSILAGGNPTPPHAATVQALRITVTTRSTSELPVPQEPTARFFRPAAENHDASPVRDRFYRYQTSTMILLRNRSPQA